MAAAANAGLSTGHWVYLDQDRTHEVHAQFALRAPRGGILATTEFPAGSRDPSEIIRVETPVSGEEDLRVVLRELEDRLAFTGRYFRADVASRQWAPLPPPSREAPDLRAHEVPIPGAASPDMKLRVHHFHRGAGTSGGAGEDDRLLISMPRQGAAGRHVLAEMRFQFPLVERGDLKVLHTRLTSATLTSTVLREHIEAPRTGYAKLIEPADYRRTFGPDWFERTRRVLKQATKAVFRAPAEAPQAPPAVTAPHRAPDALDAMKQAMLADRVQDLKHRFLEPGIEEQLLATGEHAIRRHANHLRRRHGHLVAYEVSVLEAALLMEWGLPRKAWDLVDEQGSKLLRYVAGML